MKIFYLLVHNNIVNNKMFLDRIKVGDSYSADFFLPLLIFLLLWIFLHFLNLGKIFSGHQDYDDDPSNLEASLFLRNLSFEACHFRGSTTIF